MAKNVKQSSSGGYYGKITNHSGMYVQAPNAQTGGKAPQVRKGNDLRSGGSGK